MDSYKFDFNASLGFAEKPSDCFPQFDALPNGQTRCIVAGVDEAGRGPLAGPVVAAAVILKDEPRIEGLNDSKALSEAQRESLYRQIHEHALASAVSVIDVATIDSINILAASLLAMRRSLAQLTTRPQLVLVDGNVRPMSGIAERCIVKGDSKSASIMAASILAKVVRDHIMLELHEKYPQYGFDSHKGYGCPTHLEALRRYGPSPCHRTSFEPVRSLAQTPLAI